MANRFLGSASSFFFVRVSPRILAQGGVMTFDFVPGKETPIRDAAVPTQYYFPPPAARIKLAFLFHAHHV